MSQEIARVVPSIDNNDCFLNSIRNIEPKQEGVPMEGEGAYDLWREDNNVQSMCMIDNARILRSEDPFKVSL